MTILPVIDLLNGRAVRGIAGRRDEYLPLTSRLVGRSDPVTVARAFRTTFGFAELYIADLDGILFQRPNWSTLEQLRSEGFNLLVDAGDCRVDGVRRLVDLGCRIVIGLESTPSVDSLADLGDFRRDITFSLDLKNGMPLLPKGDQSWCLEPREIVRQVVALGISSLIVLDLADVGMAQGSRTESLCESIRSDFPDLRLICGGGVRGIGDLRRWQALGVDQVLVASSLHDGSLSPADVAEFERSRPTRSSQ